MMLGCTTFTIDPITLAFRSILVDSDFLPGDSSLTSFWLLSGLKVIYFRSKASPMGILSTASKVSYKGQACESTYLFL